jgi:hypothetical protein
LQPARLAAAAADAEDVKPLWHELYGDRQVEIMVIGVRGERAAVEARRNATLLTDAELAAGPDECAPRVPTHACHCSRTVAKAAEAAQPATETEPDE